MIAKYVQHMMNIVHEEEKEGVKVFTKSQVETVELEESIKRWTKHQGQPAKAHSNLSRMAPLKDMACIRLPQG